MQYSYDGKSYLIDGKRVWLHIAEIHYFRFAAKEWRRTLNIAKAAGCNTISTYVAWNYHEPEEGVWDFSGDRDLAAFIDLAKELGMFVIVRPGPYICAEWAGGGLPAWLMKYESIEMRVSEPTFLAYTKKWFHQAMQYIVPRQVTRGGNIISVQNDNEYPGGWDKKSESYVLEIHDMLREEGIDVAITACNAHYKNNKLVINYGCGADCKKLYDDITITYNTSGEPGVIKELKAYQPNRPTIVTELWTGGLSFWGRSMSNLFTALAARMLNFTALQSMVTMYMFQGGTNFGFYGACNFTTAYNSTYPVFEGGIPTEDYYDAKLAGSFISTFGDLIAACDFESENTSLVVQHTVDGDLLYHFSPTTAYDFLWNGVRYQGTNVSRYFISPVGFRLGEHIIDRTGLCLLARHNGVLYFYGNAGEEYSLSVDGKERTITVKNHGVEVMDLGDCKIIVCDRYYAQRLWLLDETTAVLGGFLVYRDKETTVLKPCPLESRIITICSGEITSSQHPYLPPALPLPALSDWQVDPSFRTIQPTPTEKPMAIHQHGVNYGYMWYTAEVESDCDKTVGMMLSCYSGRLLTYLNGKFAGIFGDQHCGRMRWEYSKPCDSVTERVLLDLKKGKNELVFLADDPGYPNDDIKPNGILGEVYADTKLRFIEQPRYVGETTLSQDAREFLYSNRTYQREKYHTIEFDLEIAEDETFFFMIQGHPCWIKVNGEDAPPIKQANKMWQLFANTVIWVSYEVKNPSTRNRVQIQYIGSTEDIIAQTRIYVAKKASRLTNWKVSKFSEDFSAPQRVDFQNITQAQSTLLVPSGEISGYASEYEPKYFTTTFEGKDFGPLFLDMGKMKKGQIYLNGHNLGRFNGKIPQSLYYIPDAYLQETNVLTIFEEYGTPPQDVRLFYPDPPYQFPPTHKSF